ncbi:MAG: glycoside hydrolase family 99-like domain-containing protein [Nitrospiraceae bacterium]|nr:glycoside hydrolase family 99-like domain-containing protein [Nitrospiraceae bacterium]
MKFRGIALYLPQYHPIPENDLWWGKGFTEWTNTAKALPLFKNHYQPHIPTDLGFYDLRVQDTRIQQAELAREYGIEGFCYYHYWFGGKRILERPFIEVLNSGQPDFPFCICWANETWTGIWHNAPNKILIEQNYPGNDDHRNHFMSLLPAFKDKRYMKVEGKPIFIIYRPEKLLDPINTTNFWRNMAKDHGLSGLYLIGMSNFNWNSIENGFDAKIVYPYLKSRQWVSKRNLFSWLKQRYEIFRKFPTILDYKKIIYNYSQCLNESIINNNENGLIYPCVINSFDNTPRSGINGVVYKNATPELFRNHLRDAVSAIKNYPNNQKFIFLKSWNEWAEGNHLEPDLRYGHEWLKAIQDVLKE